MANGSDTRLRQQLHSSSVLQHLVQIAFLLASLNDPEALSCDIQNEYLRANSLERIHIAAGLRMN